jgi:putative membrane protein
MYGGLPMLLWWGLVIAAIVLVVRWLVSRGATGEPSARDSALTILRERYARGEIGKEEFDARKRDLE